MTINFDNYYGVNRTLCQVLEEARKCDETRNYSILPSLLHEIEVLGSRMEAKLYDIKDFHDLDEQIKEQKAILKKISKDIKDKENKDDIS